MPERLVFVRNDRPSLGVELELQLVDAESMALKNAFGAVRAELPAEVAPRVKPEIMQSYLEINTEVCQAVADVRRDLLGTLRAVEAAAGRCGLRLHWGATHPFSPWHEQRITPDPRYLGLVDSLQDTARRLVTFGLHVHVGVDSGDKAIMVCDRMLRHLPALLALSANSPLWGGRNTGLHSQRSKVMEQLPTAGLPPLMRNWSEYVWLLNHLVETGFLRSLREIWWDIRPHHNFGTVEVRVCDMPPDLPRVLGITALVQCLVADLSRQVDEGTYQFDGHPFMVRQNKWRAARYGLAAELVDPITGAPRPARRIVRELVEDLIRRGVPEELGCLGELQTVLDHVEQPTGSERQVRFYEETGDPAAVVRGMLQHHPFEAAPAS